MPETIGDILSSGGFSETIQQAMTEATQPVEKPAEPVAQPIPEQPKTEPTVTAPVAAPPAPTPEPFYKNYGFESEDELKSSLTEFKTLKEKQAYYSELEQEYEGMIKEKDQSSLFSSDQEYKNFLIAQKIGAGKDFGVVQKIIREDLNQKADIDVVSLEWQYEMPKFAGQDDYVKKGILKQLGVDIDEDGFDVKNVTLSPDQDLALARMAQTARTKFGEAKSNVQIPDKVDYKAKIQDKLKQREDHFTQLNQKWGETTNRIVEASNQVKFTDTNEKGEVIDEFVYNVDPEFKNNIPDIVTNYVMNNNVDPTPENVKGVTDLLLNAYKVANWDKMMRAARNEARTQVREQLDKERFNGQPINKTEAPPDHKPDENEEINLIAGQLFKR